MYIRLRREIIHVRKYRIFNDEYTIASLLEIYHLIFFYFLGLNWVNALKKLPNIR